MILRRRSSFLAALTSLLLISGMLAGCSSEDDGSSANQPAATFTQSALEPTAATVRESTVEPTATIETVCIEVEWSEPMWEKEVLVSEVEQLFFAKVLSMGETIGRGDGGLPFVRTPFTVEVEQHLLGDVEETITVIQHGGYDRAYHNVVEWDCDPLLEVGTTYLLAGGADSHSPPGIDGYRLVHTYGTIQVRDETHRQQLIEEYTEAIELAGVGS